MPSQGQIAMGVTTDSHTIRVNKATLEIVRELSSKAGMTMTAIIEAAVRDYRAAQFWKEVEAGYAALSADERMPLVYRLESTARTARTRRNISRR